MIKSRDEIIAEKFRRPPSTNIKDASVIETKPRKFDPLQRYNLILAVIHLIVCIVLIIFFVRLRQKNKDNPVSYINLDLFRHAFKFDTERNIINVVSEKALSVGEGGVSGLIVTFFAITAGFHLLYALNPGGIYINGVERGNNFLRWIEFSISASLMICIISLLSGVKDVSNYILIIASSVAVMSTGQWFETSSGKSKWIPIIIGFAVLLAVFYVIYTNFNQRIKESKDAGFKPPTWLYLIVIVMFIFYASFGFVPIAQMLFKGNNRKYEYSYLTLSLTSKLSLGLLVAIGFSTRSSSSTPS